MHLAGADSAVPQPSQYRGRSVWGVYVAGYTPHVWTRQEVRSLARGGVQGFLPIVVPTQSSPWWENPAAELYSLALDGVKWGLPKGAPIVLDVEHDQGAAMTPEQADNVCLTWALVCQAIGRRSWVYGSRDFLVHEKWSLKWLAEYPQVTPVSPEVPVGYAGWQYRGGVDGIDLDVFEAGRIFVSPSLKLVTLPAKPRGLTLRFV